MTNFRRPKPNACRRRELGQLSPPPRMPPEFVAAVSGERAAGKPLKLEWTTPTDDPADVEIFVSYPGNSSGPQRPQVRVQSVATSKSLAIRWETSAAGEPVLSVAGRRLVWRIPPPAVRSEAALRQQLRTEFESVMDRTEPQVSASATMPALLKSVFRLADHNDDGRLEREEFLGTPEDFQRLDANSDGWIDLDEAILGDVAVTEVKK